MEISAPVKWAINSSVGHISDIWKRYIFLVNLEEENRQLRKKVDALTNEINTNRKDTLNPYA